MSDSTSRHHARDDERDGRGLHDTCSGASIHSVEWCGRVDLIFSRSSSWDWCKSRTQKTKRVHASTTASSSSTMLEKTRHDTLDKNDTFVATRATRHDTTRTIRRVCRVVTCHGVTQQVEWAIRHAKKTRLLFLTSLLNKFWPLNSLCLYSYGLRLHGRALIDIDSLTDITIVRPNWWIDLVNPELKL